MIQEFWDSLTKTEERILLTFNVFEFRALYSVTWKNRGWTDGKVPSPEVCEVLLRGLVTEMPKAPAGKKEIARKWLCDNGYGGWS